MNAEQFINAKLAKFHTLIADAIKESGENVIVLEKIKELNAAHIIVYIRNLKRNGQNAQDFRKVVTKQLDCCPVNKISEATFNQIMKYIECFFEVC